MSAIVELQLWARPHTASTQPGDVASFFSVRPGDRRARVKYTCNQKRCSVAAENRAFADAAMFWIL